MDSNKKGSSDVAPMIWTIGTPIIFTIGLIGNILTILVLNRGSKTSSTTVYLTGLAISDLLYLLVGMPRWWLIYNFSYDIRHSSAFACKVHWLLLYAIGLMSSLFLILLTVERILSTARPYKVRTICTVKHSYMSSVLVVTFCCALHAHSALHAHILYGFDIEYVSQTVGRDIENVTRIIEKNINWLSLNRTDEDFEDNSTITINVPSCSWEGDKVYQRFYEKVYGPLAYITQAAVPQLTFFVGGSYIIWKLIENNQFRKVLKQNGKSYYNRTTQISIMLLTVNVVFFICLTPVHVFLLGRSSWIGAEMTSVQEITWAVISMLNYLNHSVNFILYFLSGTLFRNAFFDFFNCCKQKRSSTNVLSTRAKIKSIHTTEAAGVMPSNESSSVHCSPI